MKGHRAADWFPAFVRGSVALAFYGSAEKDIFRFLRIAANRGIRIRLLTRPGDGNASCIRCMVFLPDFFLLRPLRKKTGVHYRIERTGGLPFVMRALKKRPGIPLGIGIFFLILLVLAQFIWKISFSGNVRHTEEELRAFLREQQVTEGMRISDLSCEDLERLIRNEFFDITWVSCERNGTKLTVYVKENYDEEIAESEEEPYSLVAEKDASITQIITRAGTPLVSEGDEVKAGDTLVSGLVTVYDEYGETLFSWQVNADADICGETTSIYEDVISMNYRKKIYTGESSKVCFVQISNRRYLFAPEKPSYELYDQEESAEQLMLGGGFYLPVIFGIRVYREYVTEEAVYTEEEAKQVAQERYLEYLQSLEENVVEIIKKDGTIRFDGAQCEVTAEITVIERLGKVVPLDEIQDDPAQSDEE